MTGFELQQLHGLWKFYCFLFLNCHLLSGFVYDFLAHKNLRLWLISQGNPHANIQDPLLDFLLPSSISLLFSTLSTIPATSSNSYFSLKLCRSKGARYSAWAPSPCANESFDKSGYHFVWFSFFKDYNFTYFVIQSWKPRLLLFVHFLIVSGGRICLVPFTFSYFIFWSLFNFEIKKCIYCHNWENTMKYNY